MKESIQETMKRSGLTAWALLQKENEWTDAELKKRKAAAIKEIARMQAFNNDGYCVPGCGICNGSGWLRPDVAYDHKDFGKMQPCPKRSPLSLFNLSNTGLTEDEILGMNFHKLMDSESKIKIEAAITEILSRGWGWVYLWGESGNAKSLGLKIAVADLLRKGIKARYASAAEIMDDLRLAYDKPMPNHEIKDRLQYWAALPLLAIEEWGKINDTDWVAEKITQLIDDRYQSAISGQSITIFSSQEPPEEFAGYLRSRFEDGGNKVVHLKDTDLRPGMDRANPELWMDHTNV